MFGAHGTLTPDLDAKTHFLVFYSSFSSCIPCISNLPDNEHEIARTKDLGTSRAFPPSRLLVASSPPPPPCLSLYRSRLILGSALMADWTINLDAVLVVYAVVYKPVQSYSFVPSWAYPPLRCDKIGVVQDTAALVLSSRCLVVKAALRVLDLLLHLLEKPG